MAHIETHQGKIKQSRSHENRERGFTLVEMLVVITIIALIMSLVGPRVLNYLSEFKVKAAKIQMQSFSSALDLLYLDTGRYPVVRRRAGRAGEANERHAGMEWAVSQRRQRAERSLG